MAVNPEALEKIDVPYANLPWYRKRWFIVILLLVFTPALIAIVLTGDVYAQTKGETYKFTQKQKNRMIFISVIFIVFGLFRLMLMLN